MIRILIVEKEKELRRSAAAAMRELGYEVAECGSAEQALSLLAHSPIRLIVAASASGGCELCRDLRDAEDAMPVIILTDRTERNGRPEKRRIFRSGADGYMFYPLDLEELQMRVKSLLWRCRVVEEAVLRFGSCELHAHTLRVEAPDVSLELRRMEFLLLEKLLSYPGRIFTRAQLMDELWGYDSESDPRTVDTHIKRLRQKLRDIDEIRIQTVRGLGYRAALPRHLRRPEKSRL